jgi:hypothetical protein
MYPDNWSLLEQEEPIATVTIESPLGAFFSVSRYPGVTDPQHAIDQAVGAMQGEYDPMEVLPFEDPQGFVAEKGVEMSFYYLDLLISSRLLAMVDRGDVLLIQIQGENRDFDEQEPVFLAMLKTLRDSIR